MKITGNIITLNESRHIEACIASLQSVCDEIIVVDSHSSDDTRERAEAMGARVVLQSYLGDGPQKNVASAHAAHAWILSIDADERLDEEMVAQIKALKEDDAIDAYAFARKNYIGSRWIRHCGWYPDYAIRLYHKERARFRDTQGHSGVEALHVKRLGGHIIHYSYRNYHELLHKTNRFSTRGAKMLLQKGKKANGFSPFVHGASAFVRKYFLQRGFLQGLDGLTIALTASINAYMKYAKLLEMRREGSESASLWEQ
ncbi:MAG: glycosyltransferase family 2 protein [Campylobacterales bacterium]|nr:glycosyltransferase family 2 protein [Campylobacterales bacterium]